MKVYVVCYTPVGSVDYEISGVFQYRETAMRHVVKHQRDCWEQPTAWIDEFEIDDSQIVDYQI